MTAMKCRMNDLGNGDSYAICESAGRRIWVALGIITLASILLSWNPNAAFELSVGALGYSLPVSSGV
jgi:hypothetical protein